jgi:hypothetical protein
VRPAEEEEEEEEEEEVNYLILMRTFLKCPGSVYSVECVLSALGG